jgi:hypothetical protein
MELILDLLGEVKDYLETVSCKVVEVEKNLFPLSLMDDRNNCIHIPEFGLVEKDPGQGY